MIVSQLEMLSKRDIKTMHEEMKPVLEYNHQHLYGKFKEIIVDELLGNFKKQLNWYNHDRLKRHQIPIEHVKFEQVRRLMLS